ncbi:DUF202 domain-containing protein [Streptomyces xanthochromogenes]|uniref:DUF202 domain-containing protein n=1 Tax=Streptomyces xanthochromogenes TaxID=67384 RepID=A0ABQ3AG87_9ACTN|nr:MULTISPECIES: DUF202 domain-containing protein [Streptomyces]MYV89295.1 DUF202 domain-containing protein [Streptomyces sp. SID1034]GGY48468.1 hypothetical protein GCM10010326_48460 [Streptomyces xanthochromogenes]
MPSPVPARDPGLQPERTRLAWRRTTLSCTVAAVLAAKQALHQGSSPLAPVAVTLSGLAWLGFLAVAHRRIQTLSGGAPPRVLGARAALAAAACTVALACFAVASLF